MLTEEQQAELHKVKSAANRPPDLGTARNLIRCLNHYLALDPEMVADFMGHRAYCNEAIVAHPLIQTQLDDDPAVDAGTHTVSLIGFINGWCGIFPDGPKKGWGPITVEYDEQGQIVAFRETRNMVEPAEMTREPTEQELEQMAEALRPDQCSACEAEATTRDHEGTPYCHEHRPRERKPEMIVGHNYVLKAGGLVRLLDVPVRHPGVGSFHVPGEPEVCSFAIELKHVEREATQAEVVAFLEKRVLSLKGSHRNYGASSDSDADAE